MVHQIQKDIRDVMKHSGHRIDLIRDTGFTVQLSECQK